MSALALWLAGFEAWAFGVLALAWLLDHAARRRSASLRRGIWALALVVVLVLAFMRIFVRPPQAELPAWLAVALLGVWASGVALLLLGLVRSRRALARELARARPLDDPRWQADLQRLAGARAQVELRAASGLASPLCAGVRRPVIVVPDTMLALPAESRAALLAHELAHVVRGDVALLQIGLIVRALCWIDPLAWLSLARLREHAERAADDAVLDTGVASSSYAAQLVALARDQLSRAGRVAAGGLRERVLAILDAERVRSADLREIPRWHGAAWLALAIACAATLSACEARAEPASTRVSASP
jgi:beta-lactamase regulating signal transducer with metallopeptidase domain